MCDDRIIRRFAGVFIILSVALGWFVDRRWLLFTAFIGVNLIQSSVTAFCPLEKLLVRLGFPGCRLRSTP